MKKLLLTSAIVAVAGAAAAEITWSGDAEISWRSHEDTGTGADGVSGVNPDTLINDDVAGVSYETLDNGLTIEAGLDASASAELDNGITATISYGLGIDYAIEGGAGVVSVDNFPTITLESSVATLTVGGTETSYYTTFDDAFVDENDGDDLIATIDTTVGPAALGVSYVIDGDYNMTNNLVTDMYTVVAAGNVNGIKGAIGYVGDADDNSGDIMGIMAGYELNGIDIALKYQTEAESKDLVTPDSSVLEADFGYTMANGISLGLELDSTTVGNADAVLGYEVSAGFNAMGADITVAFSDDNTDDNIDGTVSIDASYEVLPGLTVLAGYDAGETTELEGYWGEEGGSYVATSYDLGGGASVYASWADYEDAGAADYAAGGTLGLALTF